MAESFRRLRTNVQFADVDKPLRSVAVVSAQPRSGKSTIAANLAVAFAQAGKRVIVADADFLHPSQHTIFGVESQSGLAELDALIRAASRAHSPFSEEVNGGPAALGVPKKPLDDFLKATSVDNLTVLPVGQLPPHALQLLAAPEFATTLQFLATYSDVVVLDLPSIAEYADTALAAAQADGVLLVVDSGESRRDDVLAAKGLLQRVHANVLGVVLNRTQSSTGLFQRKVRR